MSRRWFISDMHFGHKNILKYQEDTRKFSSVLDMDSHMINTWNKNVANKDMVYVVGDFAFYRNIEEVREILTKLKGRKILVRGNHDESSTAEYLYAGFEDVRDELLISISCGEDVLLKHYPYAKTSWYKKQNYRWYHALFPVDRGQWLIHGHFHGGEAIRGRQINVNVDSWNFRPVSEAEICRIILKDKQNFKYKLKRGVNKCLGMLSIMKRFGQTIARQILGKSTT